MSHQGISTFIYLSSTMEPSLEWPQGDANLARSTKESVATQ